MINFVLHVLYRNRIQDNKSKVSQFNMLIFLASLYGDFRTFQSENWIVLYFFDTSTIYQRAVTDFLQSTDFPYLNTL